MTDQEITAIAREYAEEKANSISFTAYADPEFKKELYTKRYANEAKEAIEFLLRRYCLVEKEAVREEYCKATAHVAEAIKSKNPLSESCGKGKRLAIQSLFPEIAKEVEK